MNSQPNPRIVGACLLGFAMVAGAYVVANFGQPRANAPAPAPIGANNVAALRVPIEVVDNDANGIEDWRDEFITTDPIRLTNDQAVAYTEPDTLTGKLGVNFFQNLVYSRGYGEFGRGDDEIISDTIEVLTTETAHKLYDTPDITILRDWTDQDIINYANGAALAITTNSVAGLESELLILQDILKLNETDRITELETLVEVYRRTRDDTLALPVPAIFAKEHLDLINTYNAMHKDIEGMVIGMDDPAYALLRLKRYEDDARGLGYALQNAYQAFEPYAELFTESDPVLLFVLFSPSNFTTQ